ncbi:MAG: hypothetical protein ABSG94_01175 [Brevinematales bacterium]
MSTKKGKEVREIIKKGVVWFFIIVLIGCFIVSLAYSPWSSRQNIQGYRVVKVGGQIYSYEPNAPYYYLYSWLKKGYSDSLKGQLDPAQLNNYVLSKSVDLMVQSGSIHQFAKTIGITPSREAVTRNIEIITRSQLNKAPDQGLLDFAEMRYDVDAVEGNNGDILNIAGLPTYAELYSFSEMENFNHSADFLYIDVTNFIVSKLTSDDIKDYYESNFSKYIKELTINELSTTSKLSAFNMTRDAQTLGWDKTVEKYKAYGANYINSEKISDVQGSLTRFTAALKLKAGGITPKPVFENREYHVVMLAGYQPFADLKPEDRKAVEMDLINNKYDDLRTKYDGTIKEAVAKAEDSLKSSQDFKRASEVSGLSYLHSDKISPLNSSLTDEKGDKVLPVLDNKDLADFLFTSAPMSVSKTFYTDGYIVIAKILKKGAAVNVDYKDLAKIYPSVMRYKSYVALNDWIKSIDRRYPHSVFTNDMNNLSLLLKGE